MTLSRIGLLLVVAGALCAQDYEGPSILTRSGGTSTRGNQRRFKLRPFVTVEGIYDTAITALEPDTHTGLYKGGDYGVETSFGVYGHRSWRKTVLGLNYRGNYRHYARTKLYQGFDNILDVTIERVLSRRVMLLLHETGGSFSRSFGGYLSGVEPLTGNFLQTPANEIFDVRTEFASTQADLTIEKSKRLSFDVGASGFLTRRRSLFGVIGADAHGDAAYRLGRHRTVGGYYRFTHLGYNRAFGSADAQTVGLHYSQRLTRHWELMLKLGGSRMEILSLTRVQLDPVVARIIGVRTGIETLHQVRYIPEMQGSLTRLLKTGSLGFDYYRGFSPGNGLYLASTAEGARARYSYTGSRYWNFGADMGYDHYGSMVQSIGAFRTVRAGVGFTRNLSRSLHTTGRFEYRKMNINQSSFLRSGYRAAVGLAFSPGDVPLSLW